MLKGKTFHFCLLTILAFIFFVKINLFAQPEQDTIKYQWPYNPPTAQPRIGGTFGEYRDTDPVGHYHNGTDMSAAGGTPVYAVFGGTVAYAYDDGGTGYDSYIRIESNVNGVSKNITYYHNRPVVSVGQTVAKGAHISNVAIDHTHLIEYQGNSTSLSGNQINALRPGGGISIYNDPWKPHVRSVKFLLDNTDTELSASSLGGRVDILAHIDEVNGTTPVQENNGTYKVGYKILSEDKSSVVYTPPTEGLRYHYYNIPGNDYVNINYYKPETNSGRHVYVITNGSGAANVLQTQVVQNSYWDTDNLPYGNYVIMVWTEDVRGNTDTMYVPVTTKPLDLIPPSHPDLKFIKNISQDSLELSWIPPGDADLKGYRLYYSFDGESYVERDDEETLTNILNNYEYLYGLTMPIYFKMTAIDSSTLKNESIQSDVYGMNPGDETNRILFVDGYDRTDGSWTEPYHNFIVKYGEVLNTSFDMCSNDEIINGSINLNDYKMVAWILADESEETETFSEAEQQKVVAYLENGGKLFVSGSEVAWDLEGSETASETDKNFLHNYLKAEFISNKSSVVGVYGADSTDFAELAFGFGTVSNGSPYPEDSPDVIEAVNGSVPVLRYAGITTAGVAYIGTFGNSSVEGQVIYTAFPFETVWPIEGRENLMSAILKYFGIEGATKVDDEENIATEFSLSQNYPNPFNPSTELTFGIGHSSFVSLKVYDVLGKEVATLVNEEKPAGHYRVTFNAKDLPSGTYIYRLKAGAFLKAGKMMLLK